MKPSTTRQPQKRVTIKAYGQVQRTGYRYAVQDVARRLDVKGHVRNPKCYECPIIALCVYANKIKPKDQ